MIHEIGQNMARAQAEVARYQYAEPVRYVTTSARTIVFGALTAMTLVVFACAFGRLDSAVAISACGACGALGGVLAWRVAGTAPKIAKVTPNEGKSE